MMGGHSQDRSCLVAAGGPAAASLLELPALGADVGLGVAVGHARRLPEVLLGLPGLHGAAEEHGALAQRRAQGELVEGEALTTCLADAMAGCVSEAEGTDGQFLHVKVALVVRDRPHDSRDLP